MRHKITGILKLAIPFPVLSCSLLFRSHGNRPSFLSQHSSWQTSRLAFAFSQAYIFQSALAISHRTLIHSTQLLLFQQ
jgi:hypothetical protein